MDVDNLQDLEKELTARINRSLDEKCASEVKKCIKKHAQKDVYKTYKPREYKRRGINNGGSLLVDSNYKSDVKNGVLTVSSEGDINQPIVKGHTPMDGGLANLIEEGAYDLYGLADKSKPTPFLEPRPFMTNAKEEILNRSSSVHRNIVKALDEYMPHND